MATLNPGIQAPAGQYITSLSYNQDAQLAAVNAGSGALASYTYDGFGQRLLKTISGTSSNIYQYGQDGMLLEETDQSGAAQADYIYLNGRPIADLAPSTGTFYSLQDDMLGTPQLATDSSQNIQWQASYEPFGQTSSVSGTITQNLRLPGQYYDLESGWNHNGFRDYIPDLGRYAEPDPLALRGKASFYSPRDGHLISAYFLGFALNDASPYAYVSDNGVNLSDPLGLCPPNKCAAAQAKVASLIQELNSPEMQKENYTYYKEIGAGALIGCGGAVLGEEVVTVGAGTPLAVGACVVGGIEGVEIANGVYALSHLGLLGQQASILSQLAVAKAEALAACH
jgi:RHS repeat-associated protein